MNCFLSSNTIFRCWTASRTNRMKMLLLWIAILSSCLHSGDSVVLPTEDVLRGPSRMREPQRQHHPRFLRGGHYSSGGGRTSSYSSHTSYSSPHVHSSSYRDNDYYATGGYHGGPTTTTPTTTTTTTAGNSFVSGIIDFFLMFGFAFCACLYLPMHFCKIHQGNTANLRWENALLDNNNNHDRIVNYRATANGNASFEHYVDKSREQVERAWSRPQATPVAEPYSGKYVTSYVDRTTQVQWDATLNLHFTPDFAGRGYKLSGDGCDVDGRTVIEDGHANYDGTAWWKERTVTGDIGLKVLSRGKFDFPKRTFQGNWVANSGEEAAYITFQAEEEPPSTFLLSDQQSHPRPSAPFEDDGDVPIVTAEVITTLDDHHDTDLGDISVPVASAIQKSN